MKSVDIFVAGEYDYKFQLGTWTYYLSYKKAIIKRTGQIYETGSPTRSSLQGLYKALDRITEPCYINVYSKTPLGFKTPKKSNNKDLLAKIQNTINRAGHIEKFEVDKEFSKPLMWEQVYGTPINKEHTVERTAKPNIDNKKEPNEVFSMHDNIDEKALIEQEWNEILNEQHSAWTPGSGGY